MSLRPAAFLRFIDVCNLEEEGDRLDERFVTWNSWTTKILEGRPRGSPRLRTADVDDCVGEAVGVPAFIERYQIIFR